MLIWSYTSAEAVGEMTFIDGTMKTSLCTHVLNEKMTKKFGRRELIQNRLFKEGKSLKFDHANYMPSP